MGMPIVNFVFYSEIRIVKEVLSNIINCMEAQFPYISESDLFDLRLVYTELLINAVVHGNRGDSSKKIKLRIEINSDEIMSVIKDEGDGFDYQDTLFRENYFYDYQEEHGRGLQLVKSLTEYLYFNEVGNEIEFHKKLSKA